MARLSRKFSRVHSLGSLAFSELLDVREELKEQYKALLRAYEVDTWEEIPAPEARKIGGQIKDLLDALIIRADYLSGWLDNLEEVDLSGF